MDAGELSPLAHAATGSTRPEILLRARGITKTFQKKDGTSKTVLQDLNLEIHRKSLVVIRGDNGSGKSTLLRILGLADGEFQGHLELHGRRVDPGGGASTEEVEDLRARHLGFIFQEDLLLPQLTLGENSELPARIHRLDDVRERLDPLQDFIFRRVELDEDVLGRRRTEVSGGQSQRAAILRALSHHPDLILADEPTANLDPEVRLQVVKLFRRLQREGTTIVVASHDDIFNNMGTTYELTHGQLAPAEAPSSEDAPPLESPGSPSTSTVRQRGMSRRRRRGCPPRLQWQLAWREARSNPLFGFIIAAAMLAGFFQLTLLGSLSLGASEVLDDVISKGSRLDRITVRAKAKADGLTNENRLPSNELLSDLGTYRRAVPRKELYLGIKYPDHDVFLETSFGLIPRDPEIEKLDLRQGKKDFEDQQALAVLLTELVAERLFGAEAAEESVLGRRISIRFRRALENMDTSDPADLGPQAPMETIHLEFVVQGVLARAEAGRNYYLPQKTLLMIMAWQMSPGAELRVHDDRLELIRAPGGEIPLWDRLHVYFNDLDDIHEAVSYFESRGFSTEAELFDYQWVRETSFLASRALGVLLVLAMGLAGLLLRNNVESGIRLKRKEIAVLKLMGMTNGNVVWIFVLSVLLCALVGGAVGFGLGSLTVEGLRFYLAGRYPLLAEVLTPTWPLAGYAFLLCVLVTLGSTYWPARRAARKEAVWTFDW